MATVSVGWATRRADTGLTIAVLFIVSNLNFYNLFYCYVYMWWGRYTWGSQRKTVRQSVLTFNLYEDFRDWTRDTGLARQAPLTYGALSPDLLFDFRFFLLHLPYALSHSQHFTFLLETLPRLSLSLSDFANCPHADSRKVFPIQNPGKLAPRGELEKRHPCLRQRHLRLLGSYMIRESRHCRGGVRRLTGT